MILRNICITIKPSEQSRLVELFDRERRTTVYLASEDGVAVGSVGSRDNPNGLADLAHWYLVRNGLTIKDAHHATTVH